MSGLLLRGLVRLAAACRAGARRYPWLDRLASPLIRCCDGRLVPSVYGVSMYCNARDFSSRAAIFGPWYGFVFSQVSTLRPGMLFLDIGANAGVFSLVASKRVGPDGRVLAFEPSLREFAQLVRNLRANGADNVLPLRCAASDRTALQGMEISPDHSGLNRLSPRGTTPVLAVDIDSLWPAVAAFAGDRPTVIKIDVEGAEFRVLQGMRRLLAGPAVEKVIVEIDDKYLARFDCSRHDIFALLGALGFVSQLNRPGASHYDEVFVRQHPSIASAPEKPPGDQMVDR